MKPVKCLHQHDFEGLRSLFSDTLASDRATGVNSSDSSSSLSVLLWSKATISASELIQQCPCQPTHSRQTSNLVLEKLGSALNSAFPSIKNHPSGYSVLDTLLSMKLNSVQDVEITFTNTFSHSTQRCTKDFLFILRNSGEQAQWDFKCFGYIDLPLTFFN
ncbi:hypothetical protein TNCV_4647191 [Trichonephila clavipes]|uniref:Uncharacterized protein n=1 Tax=Trichonephila clavipes TaxID=2585209 RepID=A0A8X6ST66_TRICX|nr:hypothetical protein TNCV_4647191 [Trichonephila clavipes]